MAKRERKVIVTAAVSGNAHFKEMSPAVPYGVKEISDSAAEAVKAGASIIHVHARDEDGTATADPQVFADILSEIRRKSPGDPVLGVTTGSAGNANFMQRLAVVPAIKPEMASFNSGTINWISKGDPETYHEIYENTFADMFACIDAMNEAGTCPEFEIFDYAMLNNILYLKKEGKLRHPEYFQFVPGALGCIPLDQENVAFFIQSVRKMFGTDALFSLVAGGRRNFRYEVFNALWGGNVRIGIEDSLYLSMNGDLADSNAAMVAKLIRILTDLDFDIATPEEVREMLQLKGSAKVNY